MTEISVDVSTKYAVDNSGWLERLLRFLHEEGISAECEQKHATRVDGHCNCRCRAEGKGEISSNEVYPVSV